MASKYFEKYAINDLLALSAAARAKSGFDFISECTKAIHTEATTVPFSRQINILISHNFELILDALVLIISQKNQESDLINEIKGNHKLDFLWNKIKNYELIETYSDIKEIKLKEVGIFRFYEVQFNNKEIITVHDLKNIRYDLSDFRNEPELKLRSSVSEEGNINNAIKSFTTLSNKIIVEIENKYKH